MSASSQTERALFGLFTKLDFRDRNNSGKKKFIGILVAYLFSNSLIAFNFFSVFDRQSFMILSLSSVIFLIALLVLNDFDNLILAGRSYSVLSILPLDSRSVFKAKFLSAALFLLPFVLVSSIPQSIFFYFYENSFADSAVFFITSFCFAMLTAAVLIFIYSIVILKFKDRAAVLMTLVQLMFFVFVFYSSTVGSSNPQLRIPGAQKLSIADKTGVRYLPQTIIAESVDDKSLLIIAIAVTALIFAIGYRFLSKNYLTLNTNATEIGKRKRSRKYDFRLPSLSRLIDRIYLRNDAERSSFHLVMNHLVSSRFLRMKYFPYIIMPVMFLAVGILFDIRGLLYFDGTGSSRNFVNTAMQLVSPSILVIAMMSTRMLISNTKIMDEATHDTDWIYRSLPVRDTNFIIKGASKSIYVLFLFPFLALMLITLAVKGSFLAALFNTMFLGSGIYFFSSVSSLFDKTMPFTVESGKFNSASKLGEIFIAMGLGVILFLIQIFAFQSIIFALASIFLFSLLSFLINRN